MDNLMKAYKPNALRVAEVEGKNREIHKLTEGRFEPMVYPIPTSQIEAKDWIKESTALEFVNRKFDAVFNGPFEFNPIQSRVFSRPGLITPATKWQATPNEIIYFTSADKIYRYNPTNLDFKILDANFGGKTVTMIKVIDDGNTLLAGTAGSLYYLDISTGKNGEITKTINGIPGVPIDAGVRTL